MKYTEFGTLCEELEKAEYAHCRLVSEVRKRGKDILKELKPEVMDLLHMAVGVSGEAGELLDAVKKHAIYNLPLDRDNVIEELGDLEFYLRGIRLNLVITRYECLLSNIKKLRKRYGKKYSNRAAKERKDKK
jgi:NTP pyrophosphatase (non-canonical NTP hydrolase)